MATEKMYGLLNVGGFDSSFIWQSLKKAGYAQNEADLLRAIEENKSKKLVHYAVIGLWEYGTGKSISLLKKLVYYPSSDVRTTTVVTIGVIAKGGESAFFGELLDDPKYKDKIYPMTILWEVGTDAALPAVLRYADKIIQHKLNTDSNDPRYVKEYLERFRSPEADKRIAQLEPIIKNMKFEY